jgi:hypothetical protein
VVESSRIAVYSVPCGLTWGADVADMEALALWGVTDWEGDRLRLDNRSLNGLSRDDFFDFFPGGGFDMSTLR